MIKAFVKVTSTMHRHGKRASSGRKGDTAMVNRLRKDLGTKDKKTSTVTKKARVLGVDHAPYGSHDGATHVATIWDTEFENIEELEGFTDRLNAIVDRFGLIPDVNLDPLKQKYSSDVTKVTEDFAKRYGTRFEGEALRQYNQKCHEVSFVYWRSQLTLIVYSDDHFTGSKKNEELGIFISAYSCPLRTTLNVLDTTTLGELEEIMAADEVATVSVNKSDGFIGTVVFDPRSGAKRVVQDWKADGPSRGRNSVRQPKVAWESLQGMEIFGSVPSSGVV